MIYHIGEPQKSFIVISSNYSQQGIIEVECRPLTNDILIGDLFGFHFQYNQLKEFTVKYELISLKTNNQEVIEFIVNQPITCKFRIHGLESKQGLSFNHSDVISSVRIKGSQKFVVRVLELEPVDKYISQKDQDRITLYPNENLFIARTIGENISLGQNLNVAWIPPYSNKLFFYQSEIVGIYTRTFGEISELIGGTPTLIKLRSKEVASLSTNESMTLIGVLI